MRSLSQERAPIYDALEEFLEIMNNLRKEMIEIFSGRNVY